MTPSRPATALLERGASAVDAVEAAVTKLEDDTTFDAGRGSFLTRDGRVQLDALIMDGHTLRAGGVACVERLRNPIQAARLVLDKSPHIYFVAQGAEEFAAAHGMPLIDNSELVLERERKRLAEAQAKEQAGLPDLTFAGDDSATTSPPKPPRPRSSLMTPSEPSPSTRTAASLPPLPPEARSTKIPAASATHPSSAVAATPTTMPPPSLSPAGESPS